METGRLKVVLETPVDPFVLLAFIPLAFVPGCICLVESQAFTKGYAKQDKKVVGEKKAVGCFTCS